MTGARCIVERGDCMARAGQEIDALIDDYAAIFGATSAVEAFRIFSAVRQEHTLTSRKNLLGHITGSALVYAADSGKFLRTYSAKLNKWLFSGGGHCDPGERPWETACRELREETGITTAQLYMPPSHIPLIFDVHPIPASPRRNEPAHWHYDMAYLFVVAATPALSPDPGEISDCAWVAPDIVTIDDAPVNLPRQLDLYLPHIMDFPHAIAG